MWSKYFDKCIECGTTKTPHNGYGLCRDCYMKKIRSGHPETYKEVERRYKQTPEYKAKQREYEKRPEVKERRNESAKRYREHHPERVKANLKKWDAKNQDRRLAYRLRPDIKLREHKHHLIRKYGEVAIQVLDRDNNKCQKCGKEEPHIHHIDGNKKNNIPENMIVLCNSCHRVLHLWVPPQLRRMIFEIWIKTPLEETAVYLKKSKSS